MVSNHRLPSSMKVMMGRKVSSFSVLMISLAFLSYIDQFTDFFCDQDTQGMLL
jgi:hypothetical protein